MTYKNQNLRPTEPTNREVNTANWNNMADQSVERLAPGERKASLSRTESALGYTATPDLAPVNSTNSVNAPNLPETEVGTGLVAAANKQPVLEDVILPELASTNPHSQV